MQKSYLPSIINLSSVIALTKVAPHKHCIVCGNTVGEEESFCDEVCESKYKSVQRRQQLLFVVFIVLLALIIIVPMFVTQK